MCFFNTIWAKNFSRNESSEPRHEVCDTLNAGFPARQKTPSTSERPCALIAQEDRIIIVLVW